MTFTAMLEPVMVDGVEIQRASIHSDDWIADMDLRIGDEVEIVRSGEVIPQVNYNLSKGQDGRGAKIVPPTSCPSCETTTVKDGAFTFCPNPSCSVKLESWIRYYVGKQRADIHGLGKGAVTKLVTGGFIKRSPAELYTLSVLDLERAGVGGAQKVYDNIQGTSGRSWLGRRNLGHRDSPDWTNPGGPTYRTLRKPGRSTGRRQS